MKTKDRKSEARARRLIFTLGMGLLTFEEPRALAEESAETRARSHFEEGEAQYRVGRFEDAFDAYAKAYELMPLPDFLFNMGQCQRNLGNYDRAIFLFESYARVAVSGELVRVERLIRELEAVRGTARAGSAQGHPTSTSTSGGDRSRPQAVSTDPRPLVEATTEPLEPGAGGKGADTGSPGITAGSRGAFGIGTATTVRIDPAPRGDAEEPGGGVFDTWWFWTLVGVAALAAAGSVAFASANASGSDPPAGTLGIIDARPAAER